MKPLVVIMQAFGPYAGEQKLDFADLRGAGFFLITGPTGSGKTTILDAMSFALYGVTSSGPENRGGRSGASMRSDHALPETPTRVIFDFALGDQSYRAERSPEQQRPKLRGEGSTTQTQDATLHRLRRTDAGALVEDGRPLASGWSKVTSAAQELLGFRSEQFQQVVMLPQGRFQRLLEADSAERERILEALFDTKHYADIEFALKDEARALRNAARDAETQRGEVLRQAGADGQDELAERVARLSVDAQEADGHAKETETAREAAQTALTAARGAVARLAEVAAAMQAQEELGKRAADIAAARTELEAAQRAAGLEDIAGQADAGALDVQTRHARLADAQQGHDTAAALAQVTAAAFAGEEARADMREQAAAEVQRLKGFAGGAAALSTARAAAARSELAAAAARTAATTADEKWRAAQERLTDAQTSWRATQAGILAAGLEDGAPCPVCGALKHPAPADLASGSPRHADLEALQADVATYLGRRDHEREVLNAAEQATAADAAALAERQRATPPEYVDEAALALALEAAEKVAADLSAGHEVARTAAHDAAVGLGASTAALAAAAEAYAAAAKAAAAAADAFAERLAAAGFDNADEWGAARRRPAEIERLDGLVTAHADQTLRATERLRLAEAAADGLDQPDLDRSAAAAEEAAAAALQARREASDLAAAAATAKSLLDRLHEIDDTQAEVAGRFEVVGRLADIATGNNSRHLNFQRYVLGAFLDDVLVAASQRLTVMTSGRYRLQRDERRSGGSFAAGLGMEAFDAWTGIARPVATLSGGETFMAALSLALGLAEVVQAHAGGIRLETVFVDEGFGSLDDESLDLAIGALMTLHDGGRLVGIISHVSELKERLDARLEITAGKSGSTARFVAT